MSITFTEVQLPTQYQQYIHISRYARWLDREKRRETWTETVSRYCNYFNAKFNGQYEETFKDVIGPAILNLEVMPSMRALMTAGPALERENIAAYNCAYIAVNNKRSFAEAMYILLCGTGVGFSCERQEISKLPSIPEELVESNDVIVVADSKMGWAKAFKKLVSSLYEGDIPKRDFSMVRPAGARLKTFGGRASGPEPLSKLFDYVIEVFKGATGRKLNSLEVHDIMCFIGEVIIVGGVRRSALISLSNLSDQRMRDAKSGQWWVDNSQRALANNSVCYTEKPEVEIFMEEWLALIKSKSGERGIFNRTAAQKQASKWGRRNPNLNYGCNPCCFVGDTRILTTDGYKRLDSLVGKDVNLINNNGEVSSGTVWSSGIRPTVRVMLEKREPIFCTPDHIFMLNTGEECRADELKGKRLMPFFQIKDAPINVKSFKAGFILGDGNLTRLSSERHLGLEVNIGEKDQDVASIFGRTAPEKWYSTEALDIAKEYGLASALTYNRELPEVVDDDFIMGLYSANGSVISSGKRVALKASSRRIVEQVGAYLNDRGISSYITTNKAKEVAFSNGSYTCRESYDLNIAGLKNLVKFASIISFAHGYKRMALSNAIKNSGHYVRSVKTSINQEVYDFTEPLTHWGVVEGVVVHNSEILLRDKEFCNLSTVVVRAEDTLGTLLAKIEKATIIGTFQATLTDFNFVSEEYKKNCDEERLLGVSMTGVMDHHVLSGQEGEEKLIKWLNALRSYTREVNNLWADRLGIPRSAASNCIKPEGTVSQLVNAASGIHDRYALQYLRTVRNDKSDPVYKFLKDSGFYVEDDVTKPATGAVFYFPEKAPENALTRHSKTAIEQLNMWLLYQRHYCEHKPSITVFVKDDEWLEVGAWVYKHFDEMSGVSFLPSSNHTYRQAPYQELSKEDWDAWGESHPMPVVDWKDLRGYEKEDNTTGQQTLSCTGGMCELN